jgi:hypothetical protein
MTGVPAAVSVLLLAAWAASRLVTDRWWWSQYAWWTPTWVWIATALGPLGVAWMMALFGGGTRGARRWRRIGTVAAAAAIGYFAFVECRVYRLIGRATLQVAAARPGGLRVLFWNPAGAWGADLPKWMTIVPCDLAVVANPNWERPMSLIGAPMGRPWYIPVDRFVVFSRYKVMRWGFTTLGLHGREQRPTGGAGWGEAPVGSIDPGRAMWLQIDTTEPLGAPVTVWILDLPSDESLGRYASAEQALAALRDWQGPAFVPGPRFNIQTSESMVGFPKPDLIVGDLNSPRGSASLSLLSGGMDNAYDQGGAGYVATFPQRFPLVHIDQVLCGPRLKATDYRVIDPGKWRRHLLQWARIEAR